MTPGHTFTNFARGCAVGLAVIDTVEKEDLLARVRERGALLGEQLRTVAEASGCVGDVRGLGAWPAQDVDAESRGAAPRSIINIASNGKQRPQVGAPAPQNERSR